MPQSTLTTHESDRVRELLGREPNALELGMFSVMWSEHCSYKSSKRYLKRLPTQGPHVIQEPGENAGAVDIGNGLAAVFKMESHNHPSFIEPFQGAATGVGGILRDIFTMGARPIALLDSLRFGSPEDKKNQRIIHGVVGGISAYGNCVGVPTVGGDTIFNDIYERNPLVNVFCLGIARHDHLMRSQAAGVGNPVIYIGAKTGRDGIHGATMASDSFDDASISQRPTVQVGDPFTEKLLMEATLELVEQGLLVGIQDMGAGGLTGASSEMAGGAGTGIELNVETVPKREQGMTPYDVMLSESQERMLLVAKPECADDVLKICSKWDVDAAVIGKVTDDGMLRIRDADLIVGEIQAQVLTDEAPAAERQSSPPPFQETLQGLNHELIPLPKDSSTVLLDLLGSPNLSSKAWVYEQYDFMVRTNTVIGPGSDAAVLRIKGTSKALAVTVDGNPLYCLLNPYVGGIIAVAEAARNLVCAGAKPLGLTDALNFGSPERPEILWQFELVIEGIADACHALDIPVVSGNVSLYNETNGISVYPSPMIGMVGLIDSVERMTSQWFKDDSDLILLLGETHDELGGSEYVRVIHHREQGIPPSLSLETERALHTCLLQVIQGGFVCSVHDCAEGGFAIAMAESCLSRPQGPIGASITLTPDIPDMRIDAFLFGETQSRAIVTVKQHHLSKVQAIARTTGVPMREIGTVGGQRLRVGSPDLPKPWIDVDVNIMYGVWTRKE